MFEAFMTNLFITTFTASVIVAAALLVASI